jgi:hypothetical protein
VHGNFVVCGQGVVDHEGQNITAENSVHGILQAHGGGFDADTLDGLHASELTRAAIAEEISTASLTLSAAVTTASWASLGVADGTFRALCQPRGGNTRHLAHIALEPGPASLAARVYSFPANGGLPEPGVPVAKLGSNQLGAAHLGAPESIVIDLFLRRLP